MITPKESMLMMFIIGDYMASNNLYYDNNVEITRIHRKLKHIVNNDFKEKKELGANYRRMTRNKAKLVLKKHYYERLSKDVCGVNDVVEPKNYVKNRLSYQEWLEIHHLNKPIKTYSIDDDNNITLTNK